MYLTCNISAFHSCSGAFTLYANSVKLTAGFYLGAGIFTQGEFVAVFISCLMLIPFSLDPGIRLHVLSG